MGALLVIVPGREVMHDSVFHLLVANTGELLASHFCSHAGFAYGDLYERRPEQIKKWKNRFGDFKVKYIDETDIDQLDLVKRNHQWAAHLKNKESHE